MILNCANSLSHALNSSPLIILASLDRPSKPLLRLGGAQSKEPHLNSIQQYQLPTIWKILCGPQYQGWVYFGWTRVKQLFLEKVPPHSSLDCTSPQNSIEWNCSIKALKVFELTLDCDRTESYLRIYLSPPLLRRLDWTCSKIQRGSHPVIAAVAGF